MTYGQEAYFSTPQSYLNKLQSLDSKAIKLAFEIPVHAGILQPDEIHKLAAAKYIIRNSTVANHTNTEAEMRSDKNLFYKGVIRI